MTGPTDEAAAEPTGGPSGTEALPQRRVYVIFGALMLAVLLAALDQTIVATALPTIVSDLGGGEHLSWVVTAYLLASTATTVLWGKLGDLVGRKPLFVVCILIFLVGSVLAGTSSTMGQLIAWRAIQGVGGGGLMVLAQAIVGDVVPPRERGRYQGLFGAVFGVASVAGPLLGGFFVDSLSWRWVFYVNVPVGVVALVTVVAVLPSIAATKRPSIDYAGIVLVGVVATAVVLITSLGGTTWGWSSPEVYGLAAVGVLALVAFVLVEQRAAEPVLPLRLFRNRVFSVASVIGFAVGFAMFGAITFLPLYLQQVKGSSPTVSGLEMTPMMLGLLLTSIGSGLIISRTGRYKVFPVLGTAITGVGLFLLSLLDRDSSTLEAGLSMFVLGLGIGMVNQVLILAVQNAVEYRDLGTATSGATFFRTIGSSVGVAVFGTIFANRLGANLGTGVPADAVPPCDPATLAASTTGLARCPADVQDWFLDGYAESLHTVFLWAVPVAVVAFALTWFLPETTLRATSRDAGAPDTAEVAGHAAGEAFALPSSRTSLEELRLILWRRVGARDPLAAYRTISVQVGLEPAECWMVTRAALKGPRSVTTMAERSGATATQVRDVAGSLAERGLVTVDGDTVTATEAGLAAAERLREAERQMLARYVAGWDHEPDVDELVRKVSEELLSDPVG